MKEFKFKRSVKVTMWVDESFSIEAETYSEALEEAKVYLDEECDIVDESIVIWETCNQLSPSENDGNATVKLYDESWNLIEKNGD